MDELVGTSEALTQVASLLDAVDHAGRAQCGHRERLALVKTGRTVLRRVEALLATLVAEADAAGSPLATAGTRTTSWLAQTGGTTPGEAAGLLFAGRDMTARPVVHAAALAGRIGVKQARAVVKVVGELPAELTVEERGRAEQLLLTKAGSTPAAELAGMGERVLAQVCPAQLPDDEQRAAALEARTRRARGRRELAFHPDGDGSVKITGSLPELDASPFQKLIDAYVEHDRRVTRDAAPVDPVETLTSMGQRRADALIALAADHTRLLERDLERAAPGSSADGLERAAPDAVANGQRLAAPAAGDGREFAAPAAAEGRERAASGAADGPERAPGAAAGGQLLLRNPRVAGDRPRVVVLIREDALRARAEQAGVLDTGARIAPGALRRLCCDADLTPVVLGSNSEILDVGRASRLVTDPIRQALSLRDGGCAFPGCTVPDARCEAHHIVPWWAGGRTALTNLVLLCPHHHATLEPPRFRTGPPPNRWQVRIDCRGRPEFLKPASVDAPRTPVPAQKHGGLAELGDSDTDPNPDLEPDTELDTDPGPDLDSDSSTDGNGNSDSNGNGNGNGDSNGNGNGNGNSNGNGKAQLTGTAGAESPHPAPQVAGVSAGPPPGSACS